jgi:hypothetical protein
MYWTRLHPSRCKEERRIGNRIEEKKSELLQMFSIKIPKERTDVEDIAKLFASNVDADHGIPYASLIFFAYGVQIAGQIQFIRHKQYVRCGYSATDHQVLLHSQSHRPQTSLRVFTILVRCVGTAFVRHEYPVGPIAHGNGRLTGRVNGCQSRVGSGNRRNVAAGEPDRDPTQSMRSIEGEKAPVGDRIPPDVDLQNFQAGIIIPS